MTNNNSENPARSPRPELPDRDLILSRVVDGRAGEAEWRVLEVLAARDPSLWRELAQMQRDQRVLESYVRAAGSIADAVDLPEHEAPAPIRLSDRFTKATAWLGWAAAAAIALAYVNGVAVGGRNGNIKTAGPNIPFETLPVQNSDEALANYYKIGAQEGRVLGELEDRILLQSTPASEGGGWDVIFVRPVVERSHVPSLYQFSRNEMGSPQRGVPVPMSPRLRIPG